MLSKVSTYGAQNYKVPIYWLLIFRDLRLD